MELLDYEREHIERLRKSLAECMVLLKSNGEFPLENPGKLALYGGGARYTIKGGTGSGEVNSRYFITVEEGLLQAGFEITTGAWLDAYTQVRKDAENAFLEGIQARARKNHTLAIIEAMGEVMPEPEYNLPLDGEGEAAVYVLSRISGEGNDRRFIPGDVKLTETEQRDILALQKKYKKFMLVLNVGGVVDLSPVASVENILLLSQLGVETGGALADVLLGKENPSGKLTTSWAAVEDYCQEGEFGEQDDTRYKEGIYVGYRYFDSVGKQALFPFGFGLSYTEFAIEAVEASLEQDVFSVTAEVKNTGNMPGKEVLQLYVSCPEGKLEQPYQVITAFDKTELLQPGESRRCKLSCKLSEVASYDEEAACYVLEKGTYLFRLGNSSVNTKPCGVVELAESIKTMELKNCCGKPDFADWKPEKENAVWAGREAVSAECPRFTLAKDAVSCVKVAYEKEYEIDAFVEGLTDEQLAHMSVGVYEHKNGIAGIVGDSSLTVAGAAGETSHFLADKGVPALIMADGPAGLRLSRDYFADGQGQYSAGEKLPESMAQLVPGALRALMNMLGKRPKKNQEILHYYTTAIPIGTAIAQSWNVELAQDCGDIVGAEMERTGVHLWLAPALNIHRDIRCGRNFEYFSEDPLLSGKFAAALTRGVQKHKNCGVTIKHYATNNQETNRYNNNSQVSERALREIYLRGFGICVREAQPKTVMTSYNLLNGVHTAANRDLIEDILRCEFGFEGFVMTDWIIAGGMLSKGALHPAATAGTIAAAGGDLMMPGCKKDVKDVMQKLKTGELSRKQLMQNVTRVYRAIKQAVSA